MMTIMLSSSLIVLLSIRLIVAQEWLLNIDSGAVRGFWSEQHNVWTFRGIPYAAPMIGELRFKAPLPPAPWTDIFNATNANTICYQVEFLNLANSSITEDCLVINVFAPEAARSQGPLPVLFMIHGGAFAMGNGNRYNPQWTTRHGIILVTFNYRLGPFGYLCLGTEKIPGNAGLKDILGALRWTKRNIAQFGGDPDAITIYGESAGAVQCEALVISKAAEGLFHRAIVESGSVLCYVATSYHRLGIAKALAYRLGVPSVDDLDAVAIAFENVSADVLQFQDSLVGGFHNLCVERRIEGVESLVPNVFRETIKTGNYRKVPILFAYTELDGMIYGEDFYQRIPEIQNNFEHLLPGDLVFGSDEEKMNLAQKIKEVYFGTNEITNASLRNYMEYLTDIEFVNAMLISSLEHAKDVSVYLMEFSYRGGFSGPSLYPELNAASHADIVAHVMDLGYYDNRTLEQDQKIRDRMTELFTNFVKYGDPTPASTTLGIQWLPFTEQQQYYLNVGNELSMQQFPVQNRSALWADIYDSYYYPPPVFEGSGASTIIPSLILGFINYSNCKTVLKKFNLRFIAFYLIISKLVSFLLQQSRYKSLHSKYYLYH